MTRKDPITGCTVLTQPEFWQAEALHEGKGRSGGELATEFAAELEADRQQCEDRYRDPAVALETLRQAVEQQNDDADVRLPLPVEVREVLDAGVGQSFRESSTGLRARALREDGVEDIIEFHSWHSSGSFHEPPDGDAYVTWENLDDKGEPIEWRHLYTITISPERPGYDAEARAAKVGYLHTALRHAGVRARIHGQQLQYNAAQEDKMHKALARYLINLDPFNGLWREAVRS